VTANPGLTEALSALADRRDLTAAETETAIGEILEGSASEACVAAFLTALRVKGETADELAGAVRAVRSRVDDAGLRIARSGVLDTCGTGGDCAQTVNISTAAAIVVAACGIPVAKHGNRAASGNSGSAEVLAELGVAIDADPHVVSRCLAELGLTFLFAPRYHPGLKLVAPVRRQLPFRTLLNLVGPLANPAQPEYQLVGVAGEPQAWLVARALATLGVRRALVVTGSDGLDEISLADSSLALVVEGSTIEEKYWRASDFGLGRVASAELRVSGPAESADRIARFLAGERGPIRDTILANAAAALWVVEPVELSQAMLRASDVVDSGQARELLSRWRSMSAGRAAE
jgi:anthranilate phosphoribosyltransferase